MPLDPNVSDDESLDDDTTDPDYLPEADPHNEDTPGPSDLPASKRRCIRPVFEELDDEDEEEHEEDVDDPDPQEEQSSSKGKGKGKGKGVAKKKSYLQTRPTTWKKVDITNPPLPEYQHTPPQYVDTPQYYFNKFFTHQLIKHITYQTNLYATQKDVATTFSTTDDEILTFIAILLYMGVVECPSLDDYWAMKTRVPQVADLMSSKRFRLLRRTIHFNDNSLIHGTVDRFYKIRPIFNFLNRAFQCETQTPKQSIDEVMVGYKGKTAGNLRQYIKNKPDKWGFKLFSRASEDGFIHDMVLYQGLTTLQSHGVTLTPEQEALGATSQIVSTLAKTMTCSSPTAIFADNFFTSLEIVRYLQTTHGCRYTGTARENRIGNPPLKPVKDLDKKAVPRGTFDYTTTDDGIIALRWKDNKVVTMLSNDLGANPISKCLRYSKDTKQKEEVECPNVIKSYNANMGGIDKSDMLVHLYRTPMKSKRWYMRLFAYCLDLSVTNAWLSYRRDCKSLGETKGLCLKDFRIELFHFARNTKPLITRRHRSLTGSPGNSPSPQPTLPKPIRGQRSAVPERSVRFDSTLMHLPDYLTRQTCKQCSRKGHIIRSNVVCQVCKVHLCLNADRNCFVAYHQVVA